MSVYLTREQKRITRDDEELRRKRKLTHINENVYIYIVMCVGLEPRQNERKRKRENTHRKMHRKKQHKSITTPHKPIRKHMRMMYL